MCHEAWRKITSNNWVLSVVDSGYKIPLKHYPFQKTTPSNPPATTEAHTVLVAEAKGLRDKGAVKLVKPKSGQYVSSYFAVPKPRSTKWRPILNLKYFNKSVRHYKLRLETFSQVRQWVQPGYFTIGLDLQDQFLSVPVNRRFRKFLRFSWLGKLFQWAVLPFGLRCSPRVVSKLLRPVIAFLRETWGIMITIYMDDMFLQAPTRAEVYLHAQLVILVLLCLGLELNWTKSSLVPSQTITHLGFEINTATMTATLPIKKIERLRDLAHSTLQAGHVTVHNAEKLLGLMESVRPVTPLAALHYRALQKQLLLAKRYHRRPAQVITYLLIHRQTFCGGPRCWGFRPAVRRPSENLPPQSTSGQTRAR